MGDVVGSIVGGAISSSAAGDAADAQVAAAQIQADSIREGLDFQKEVYSENRQDFAPYRGVGYNALYAMSDMLGLPRRFGESEAFTDFSDTSEYTPRDILAEQEAAAAPTDGTPMPDMQDQDMQGTQMPATQGQPPAQLMQQIPPQVQQFQQMTRRADPRLMQGKPKIDPRLLQLQQSGGR